MKFTSVAVLLASAVAVSAQGVSSLPPCAVSLFRVYILAGCNELTYHLQLLCSVQATSATTCGADVACSCQPANQALIAAQLLPCLQANCSASDAALGIQIGQALCASAAPSSSASAPATTSSPVAVMTSSSMPAAMTSSSVPSTSIPGATLVAVSSSTVLTTKVSTVTPSVALSQV